MVPGGTAVWSEKAPLPLALRETNRFGPGVLVLGPVFCEKLISTLTWPFGGPVTVPSSKTWPLP